MKEEIKQRDFGKILYTSQTGKGKTYSFRNMDENTTGFINAENKPLPFRKNFKHHGRPKTVAGLLKCLKDFSDDPEIDCIVLDSLSGAMDTIEREMIDNFSGYDIWSNYNTTVANILDLVKKAPKEVFVTSHYEVLSIDKNSEKRVKTLGKRWEGLIEKEFTFVMYGECKFKDDKPEYSFRLVGPGISAKVPPDVFGEGVYTIPNDSKVVLETVRKYYTI